MKEYKNFPAVRHQDDVYTSVKPYSTWQGKVLVLVLLAIAYVLVVHVLPYLAR